MFTSWTTSDDSYTSGVLSMLSRSVSDSTTELQKEELKEEPRPIEVSSPRSVSDDEEADGGETKRLPENDAIDLDDLVIEDDEKPTILNRERLATLESELTSTIRAVTLSPAEGSTRKVDDDDPATPIGTLKTESDITDVQYDDDLDGDGVDLDDDIAAEDAAMFRGDHDEMIIEMAEEFAQNFTSSERTTRRGRSKSKRSGFAPFALFKHRKHKHDDEDPDLPPKVKKRGSQKSSLPSPNRGSGTTSKPTFFKAQSPKRPVIIDSDRRRSWKIFGKNGATTPPLAEHATEPPLFDTITPTYTPPIVEAVVVENDKKKQSASPETAEQAAYGVAVQMLVDGATKPEVRFELISRGWAEDVVDRVAKNINQILPKSPQTTKASLVKNEVPAHLPAKANLEEDPRLGAFARMRKMGVPAVAIEHRMKTAGLSADDIAQVLDNDDDNNTPATQEETPVEKKKKKPVSIAEDPVLGAYAKMLKFGVGIDSVLQKMEVEDVPKEAIHRFKVANNVASAADDPDDTSGDVAAEPDDTSGATTNNKTMALHWEKMGKSAAVEKSVWKGDDSRVELDNEDVAVLEDIFAARPSVMKKGDDDDDDFDDVEGSENKDRKSEKTPKKVSLLDKKRTQNVTIALSKFRRRFRNDFDKLWVAVEELSSSLDSEALERLKDIEPTEDECDTVSAWVQQQDEPAEHRLAVAERFVLATSRGLPRHVANLDVGLLVATFGNRADDVVHSATTTSRAAKSLVESRGLALTLQRILAVGNAMNAGTRRGGAHGIRLASLLAIVKTKGRDRKTTVLDYVINGLVKRGHGDALSSVAKTLPDLVAAASKVSIGDVEASAKSLASAVSRAEKAYEMATPKFHTLDTAVQQEEAEDMALEDRPKRLKSTSSTSSSSRPTSPLSFLTSPKNKSPKVTRPSYSVAEAARLGRRRARLSTFLDQASKRLRALDKDHVQVAVDRAQGVCEYFGEDPSTYRNVGAAFETMNEFLTAFQVSVGAVMKTIEAEQKIEERRRRSAAVLEKRLVEKVAAPKIKGKEIIKSAPRRAPPQEDSDEELRERKSDGSLSKVHKLKFLKAQDQKQTRRRVVETVAAAKVPDVWQTDLPPTDNLVPVPNAWANMAALAASNDVGSQRSRPRSYTQFGSRRR